MSRAQQKKRIIYVCHRIPYPPNKGDKIRSFNFLRILSSSFEIYCAFLIDNKNDIRFIKEIQKYAKETAWDFIDSRLKKITGLASLLGGKPISLNYFRSKKLQSSIDHWLREYDFCGAVVYSSSMAQYFDSKPDLKKVIDFCDVDSQKWSLYSSQSTPPLSWLYKLESHLLQKYERQISINNLITFVTEGESNLFKKISPRAMQLVVPNGIDGTFYNGKRYEFDPENSRPISPYIVFTGAMDYKPNVDAVCWFAKDIWPIIRKKLPALEFNIVGMNPTRQVRNLARKNQDIHVTGYVKDTRPYIQSAELFVAPMRIARGVQTKLLESIALSCPTVTTDVAAKSLGRLGDLVSISSAEPEEFALKVLEVYESRSQQRKTMKHGFRSMLPQLTWEKALSDLIRYLKIEADVTIPKRVMKRTVRKWQLHDPSAQ